MKTHQWFPALILLITLAILLSGCSPRYITRQAPATEKTNRQNLYSCGVETAGKEDATLSIAPGTPSEIKQKDVSIVITPLKIGADEAYFIDSKTSTEESSKTTSQLLDETEEQVSLW